MIKFTVETTHDNGKCHVISKGSIKGNGEDVMYEMVSVLEQFDEVCDGEVLVDAFEKFIERKMEGGEE